MSERRGIIENRPYLHFKGKMYFVHKIAEDTETGRKLVCYQALYPPYKNYVRDYGMFASKVDRDKYPCVEQKYRFELCEKYEVKMCRKEN